MLYSLYMIQVSALPPPHPHEPYDLPAFFGSPGWGGGTPGTGNINRPIYSIVYITSVYIVYTLYNYIYYTCTYTIVIYEYVHIVI